MKVDKRGLTLTKAPTFTDNPFMGDKLKKLPVANRTMTAPKRSAVFEAATGEQIGKADGYYRRTQVDASQHIKLYLEGIGALQKLNKPGLAVFQTLYKQMLKQFDKDSVIMTPAIAKRTNKITENTYFAGITQLIKAGFIARSDDPLTFWINPTYMFNGNRLRFVQDYDLKHEHEDNHDEEEGIALVVTTMATLEHNRAKQIDLEEAIAAQIAEEKTTAPAPERADAGAQAKQPKRRTSDAPKAKPAPRKRVNIDS